MCTSNGLVFYTMSFIPHTLDYYIGFDTLNIIPEYSVYSQNGKQADCIHGRATW